MDVRNLPQAQSGDKLRVHKVPLPSIFPSPGQEGRHKHPITSPPLAGRPTDSTVRLFLPSSHSHAPSFVVRWHTMGLFGFDSGSRRYVSMWS